MTLMAVPVIDIAAASSPEGRLAVARAVGEACRDIGFLVITGHGVPKTLIERVERTARDFFELPTAEKTALKRPREDQVRGYSAVGDEGLSYSLDEKAPGDLKESFSIGPIDVPDTAYFTGPAAGPHFAPNLWPGQIPDFRESWSAYFEAMSELAATLMRLFGISLGLDADFFGDKIDRHISMFRVLNYPAQTEPPLPGQMRAGAHSDYGSLTIVKIEDRPGGLQVFNKEGEWVDVPAVPDAFVVNIGDLMMQWTNDLWTSTLHRVVNPPVDRAGDSRRQSLVFFHQPNYDALVECLPGCRSPDRPAKYPPVTSGDHLRSKFVKQTTFGAGLVEGA
ncbi:isopenicillin N synthase family dioxygenase [Telmatospirillum siberiense]|uniref:2-oxoglutarate-dependent ethylene/succinate-forming enzyme n=1 Tax=Telmatospirillum siberiense TaxID=382514 RepID=A0A2N3PSQ9_9PROT|nr:2-oxoglutarate and iron-dependent oxygenase domain-containing protein [Telmatospirillum siberiense]PKU23441.1 2OG-Fe(II) oxygenase [Telmatospirillum siberiense]